MGKEPVITVGAIVAAMAAVLAVGVAFGMPITVEQQKAILAAIPPLAVIVLAFIGRRMVVPNGSVVERAQGGKVVAGEANELPTGTVVRDVGSLDDTEGED